MTEWTLPMFMAFCLDTFLDICRRIYITIPVFGGNFFIFICAYTIIALIIEEFLGEEKDE